ncbi:hypothetical protein [Candidatus Aalborgicola defluviihabitans]|uniref:hypothetical protein n=1 Tax=Candidatus Aalborgicola defluviihabitans TaxID=3386187 RepID=UPI0039B8536C
MLLTHGARSVLRASKVAQDAGREVCGVRRWALDVQSRSNHNKAACALGNKLARICYATLRDKEPFGECQAEQEDSQESFVMPAWTEKIQTAVTKKKRNTHHALRRD